MSLIVYEGKKSTDRYFPVYLASSNGEPVTGLLPTEATVQYATAGAATLNPYTLDTENWIELGEGFYSLQIGASEFASEGGYPLLVMGTGADTVAAYVEVRDRLPAEMDDDIISLTATLTTVASEVSAVLDDTGTSGVKLAPTAIGTAQWQNYAIPTLALATGLYTHIADQVLAALATSQQGTGSVGEAIVTIRQILAGYRVADTSDNTVKFYESDGETLRLTLTKQQATGSSTTTYTPS